MTDYKTIYLVIGDQGEYSDHSEWVVAAYRVHGLAEEHAKKASDFADRLQAMEWEDRKKMADGFTLKTPLDPVEGFDLCGMYDRSYRVEEVQLLEALP